MLIHLQHYMYLYTRYVMLINLSILKLVAAIINTACGLLLLCVGHYV